MKKSGLLERITKKQEGICDTCGNRIDIGADLGYGCEAHDKLILKNFPPYHGNCKCADWKEREKT